MGITGAVGHHSLHDWLGMFESPNEENREIFM